MTVWPAWQALEEGVEGGTRARLSFSPEKKTSSTGNPRFSGNPKMRRTYAQWQWVSAHENTAIRALRAASTAVIVAQISLSYRDCNVHQVIYEFLYFLYLLYVVLQRGE